jgi:hypothetical protein
VVERVKVGAARVTPYNAAPITAVFDLTGIEQAAAGVRASCNW